MSKRSGDFWREIAGEALTEVTSAYYAVDTLLTALESLESCIEEVLRDVEKAGCTTMNYYECMNIILERLVRCHREAMNVVAAVATRQLRQPMIAWSSWLKPVTGTESLGGIIEREVVSRLTIADAIIRFLVSAAMAKSGLAGRGAMADAYAEAAHELRSAVDPILKAKGVIPITWESYFTTRSLTILLNEALAHVKAARREAEKIAADLYLFLARLTKQRLKEGKQ